MVPRNYAASALLIVLSTILAAAGWIFSMKSVEGMPPIFFIGIRFAAAGLVVGLVAVADSGRLDLGQIRRGLWPGALLAVSMMLWIIGLGYSDNLGVGSFICALGNILAPIAGRLLYRWPVPGSTRVAGVVAMFGMGFLFLEHGVGISLADTYFLGSALASSINFVLTSHRSRSMSVLVMTAVQLLVTGLVSLAVSAAVEPWPTVLPGVATIGWVLASILLATSLRFFLAMKAQSLAPVAFTAILMCLEPVWTTLIATVWLGTTMTGLQITGCTLIFVALAINRWDVVAAPWRTPRAEAAQSTTASASISTR